MTKPTSLEKLVDLGLSQGRAEQISSQVSVAMAGKSAAECWQRLSKEVLTPETPFPIHRYLFDLVYADWEADKEGPPPAWIPGEQERKESNLGKWMEEKGGSSYQDFFRWSVEERESFWRELVEEKLSIPFQKKYSSIVDLSDGVETPRWFPGAKLNIAESCFSHADADQVAIVSQSEEGPLQEMTYGELDHLSNRVANGLIEAGFQQADAIAIDMLMTREAVAIYLGIVKAGCVVVGIADSFAPAEVATRLRIGQVKGIFTQDVLLRGGKTLPMFEKIREAKAPRAIVLSAGEKLAVELRKGDLTWDQFLSDNSEFSPVPGDPDDATNILFSSGTTGDPKAIPWTHTTPIKCAADAYLHQDVQPGDVVAWPTSLGWMMGPWLIYAALMNRGTMGLYYGAPTGKGFAKFVQDARVNMLGVVPSLVKAWRNSDAVAGLDWSGVKLFSSTGECSNFEEMLFLMSVAGYKPVIEYCGGTEIGGGFITGSIVQPQSPGTFSTPSLGLDFFILDETGSPTKNGELFLLPPSVGLSTRLLNRDHHEVYYAGTPKGPQGEVLRRHGDQKEALPHGYFRGHGRADDAMNLGGIKISSGEIERVVNRLPEINETAAIAVTQPGGGASLLVIYVVTVPGVTISKEDLQKGMQKEIKTRLNPLFKIHEIELIDKLPRTASNKVMRRVLRDQYSA